MNKGIQNIFKNITMRRLSYYLIMAANLFAVLFIINYIVTPREEILQHYFLCTQYVGEECIEAIPRSRYIQNPEWSPLFPVTKVIFIVSYILTMTSSIVLFIIDIIKKKSQIKSL